MAYRNGDPVARDLAHRLVALAGTPATAIPLSPEALETDLRMGGSSAYVLELPRVVLDDCLATQRLVHGVPWLDPRAVLPLLDVRERVILRRGAPAVTLDWDGTLRIAPR